MADYIRILSLHKEGGMFLDLDVLTLKPYDGPQFRNFVTVPASDYYVPRSVLQRNATFTNSILHLEHGHRLIDLILELQSEYYDAEGYTFNGPGALSEAMDRLCNSSRNRTNKNNKVTTTKAKKGKTCSSDVQFVSKKYFHPISDDFIVDFLFRKKKATLNDYDRALFAIFFNRIQGQRSYGLHFHDDTLYRYESVDLDPNSTQTFAILAAQNFPQTLKSARQFITA